MKCERFPSHPPSALCRSPSTQVETINNFVFVLPNLLKNALTHTHIFIYMDRNAGLHLAFSLGDLAISTQIDLPPCLRAVLCVVFSCIIINKTTPNDEYLS